MSEAFSLTVRERGVVIDVASGRLPALEKAEWSGSPILAACMAVVAIDDAWDEGATRDLLRVLDRFRVWPDSRIAAAVGTRLGMLRLWWTDQKEAFETVLPIAEAAVKAEPSWILNNLLLFDCLSRVGATSEALEIARILRRPIEVEDLSDDLSVAFDTLFIGARSWTPARAQDLFDRARSTVDPQAHFSHDA